jgi:hypothetical protein
VRTVVIEIELDTKERNKEKTEIDQEIKTKRRRRSTKSKEDLLQIHDFEWEENKFGSLNLFIKKMKYNITMNYKI